MSYPGAKCEQAPQNISPANHPDPSYSMPAGEKDDAIKDAIDLRTRLVDSRDHSRRAQGRGEETTFAAEAWKIAAEKGGYIIRLL
jgi:hypothetical protein